MIMAMWRGRFSSGIPDQNSFSVSVEDMETAKKMANNEPTFYQTRRLFGRTVVKRSKVVSTVDM